MAVAQNWPGQAAYIMIIHVYHVTYQLDNNITPARLCLDFYIRCTCGDRRKNDQHDLYVKAAYKII